MASNISINTTALGIPWALGETYRVAITDGFVEQEDGLRLPLKANNSLTTFSTWANPPQISSTIPAHTTTANIGFQNISFTIDRNTVSVLGGNVFVNRQGSPNVVVKTYVVNSSNTPANVVTIPIVGNIEANQTYFITANANIFIDSDGFKNNAISNSSTFRFVAPTAPQATFYPLNSNVADKNITTATITFDRTVTPTSGNIYLYKTVANTLSRTYNVNSANVTIANNVVSLSVVDALEPNIGYTFRSDANVLYDATQIKYPSITNWAFTSPVAPFVQSSNPANASSTLSRSTSNISFTLDRTVSDLTGNIYLYQGNNVIKTWRVGSNANVSGATYNLSIDTGLLESVKSYYVLTDANIAWDATHIRFPGITSNVGFAFTTRKAPELSSTSPTAGTAQFEDDNNISFTLDAAVTKATGNVYLYKEDIVNGNVLVKTYDIVNNTTLSTDTITLDTTGLLPVMEKFYVLTDFDVLSATSNGDKFRGIRSPNEFYFQTAIPRTYISDQSALLFPNNIPQITEADTGATYTITLTLSSAVGQIQQLNDNFASPSGWNSSTRTYTITGNKTACNSALSSLYFFPFRGITSDATITYSQTKGSTLQKTIIFSLLRENISHVFVGNTNNNVSVPEDSKNNMLFTVAPNWDSNCVVMLRSFDSLGNPTDAIGAFNANSISGWTNVSDGIIYKEYSRPANVSVWNSQKSEINSIYYWLASDVTDSFIIYAYLGVESSRSGNILVGGTVYEGTNNYSVTPSSEYSLTTSTTYSEDTVKQLVFEIVDADTHPNITYNVAIAQISPSPGLNAGAFVTPGFIGNLQYGSVSDTQIKSAWTNAISYYPPSDYTDTITLGLTLTKIQTGKANVTLANNVAITLTNVASHNEYQVTPTTYVEDANTNFGYTITDLDLYNSTYYVTIRQVSGNTANIIVDSVDYGNVWTASGSKSTINSMIKSFYPYPDDTGNVVFGLTQIKSSQTGNITQANNVSITYTNSSSHAEYSFSGGTYVEDGEKVLSWQITDTDSRFNNYWVGLQQISPDSSTNPANIIINGTNYGTNVTLYDTKSNINAYAKSIIPPADWTGNIVYGYTQIKNTIFGNITQASNVAITYVNSASHDEYSLPFTSANVFSNVSKDLTGAQAITTSVFVTGQGTNGSNVIIDSGSFGVSITNFGVTYSSAQAHIYSTSLAFNGSSYFDIPYNSNFDRNNDFTLEMWVYKTTSGIEYLISNGMLLDTSMFTELYGTVTQNVEPKTAMPLNQWNHVAVTRSGNTVRVFLNGIQRGNFNYTGTTNSNGLRVGVYAGNFFNGYIEQFSYVKGIALYTSNFTPADTLGYINSGYFAITDQANNKSYSVTLSVGDYGNLYQSGNLQGNTYTISGNISTVNNKLLAVSLLPAYVNSVSSFYLNYTQTQTTNNILQANVQIPMTLYPIPATPTIGAASILSNAIGNVSATISYTAPTLNGSVNYYLATTDVDATKTGINITNASGNITVGGLTPGVAYRFKVNASSNYGSSPYSSLSNSLTIYTPPAAPTIGTATVLSNSSATVTYTAPAYTGGRAITLYTATSSPGGLTGTSSQVGAGTIFINGLSNSTAYTFTVTASHQDGTSTPSSASNSVTTFANAQPSVPLNVTATTISNVRINVSWTAPTYSGNVPITSYTVTPNIGNAITLSGTTASFEPLTPGTTYSFTVYATNQFGNGIVSGAVTARTDTVPSEPGNVRAIGTSDTSMAITYTAPSYTGNIPVTSYTITSNTGVTTTSNTTLASMTGLTSGQTYTFTVSATTAYGTGANSTASQDRTTATTLSSVAFGGSTNTSLVTSLPFALGNSDFTIEGWLYTTDTASSTRGIWDMRGVGGSYALRTNSTNQYVLLGTSTNTLSTVSGRINNDWQHVAVTRRNGNVNVYVGGTLASSNVSNVNITGTTFRLSGFFDNLAGAFTYVGNMDEVRVSNVARYTGNFTPSTTPFTSDADTMLLLHFGGLFPDTFIADSSDYNCPITNNLNQASISVSRYKF